MFWIYFIPILATAAADYRMCTRINWSTATEYLPVSGGIQEAPSWFNSWLHTVQISKSFRRCTKLQILYLRYELIAPLWLAGCDTSRSCTSGRNDALSSHSMCGRHSVWNMYQPLNIVTTLRPQVLLVTCWKATKAVRTCSSSFLGNFSLLPHLFQGDLEANSCIKSF